MNRTSKHLEIPPVVKAVRVSLPVEAAFRRFTRDMGSWWPLATHSVGGDQVASVTFGTGVGEPIQETLKDGTTHRWGTIVAWDPPGEVRFTWHPGRSPNDEEEVTVRFREVDGGTEVSLIHSGWEVHGERAYELRSDYDEGWTGVLGLFAREQ